MNEKKMSIEDVELTLKYSKYQLNRGIYVVSTPIGNILDISLRALLVLNQIDIVICEDRKNGSRLLKLYNINKEIQVLNEHNEKEKSQEMLNFVLLSNKTVALISDCGSPLFEDPGNYLINLCLQNGIDVYPLPGASSLTASLMASGLSNKKFFYYGFLPANRKARIQSLKQLGDLNNYDLIFLDTPYRLTQILEDMNRIFANNREAMVFYKLTTNKQKIFWGKIKELLIQTDGLEKGEFVLILKKKRKHH